MNYGEEPAAKGPKSKLTENESNLRRPQESQRSNGSPYKTWPEALRVTMSILANSPDVMDSLRDLKRNQEAHEKEWATGRENIVKKYEAREKMSSILTDMGGKSDTLNSKIKEERSKELKKWDENVWTVSQAMVRNQAAQLERLGIPFFPAISNEEHQGNQRRMLAFLDDVVGDSSN